MRKDAIVIGLISFAHGMSHFFQPLAGFVVDRYGARSVLLGGIAFFVAGTALMGLSTSYATLAIGAALTGIGNSVFHPADFAILNARVSPQRLGHAFSAHGMVGYLGYAVAPAFGVAIGAAYGWHAALLAGAGLGAALLVLLLLNAAYLHIEAQPRKETASFASDARVLFAWPVVLCFLYFTVFAAGLAGLQSFGVSASTSGSSPRRSSTAGCSITACRRPSSIRCSPSRPRRSSRSCSYPDVQSW